MNNLAEKPGKLKIFFKALRPFSFTASITPVLLGVSLVYFSGYTINWITAIITLIGVVSFHSAANLFNDCFDFKRGLDKEILPMSGVIVRGWLSTKSVFRMGIGFLISGSVCGAYLTYQAGSMILILGAIGAILAMGYTKDGFCLKYAGLGDLTIFICFGILPVYGSWWVQTGAFHWLPVAMSLPLVMYTVGILHSNNWHDLQSDPECNCRTVAVKLGEKGSAIYYKIQMLFPFIFIIIMTFLSYIKVINISVPLTALIVLLALPSALKISRINKNNQPQKFAMLDGLTAQVQFQFGILISTGFVIGSFFN